MRILAPKKFSSLQSFKDEELTLREFSNLFKGDPIGERLVKSIKDEILAQRAAKAQLVRQKEIMSRRKQRLDQSTDFDYERVNITLAHLQAEEHHGQHRQVPQGAHQAAHPAADPSKPKLDKKVVSFMERVAEDGASGQPSARGHSNNVDLQKQAGPLGT